MSQLGERLAAIESRIQSKLDSLNRIRDEVTLVVVTKNHPVSVAKDLFDLGCRDFGENRDQEAAPKAAALAELVVGARWHFIGQLQSNKAKRVADYASVVHSLDRTSLLEALIKAVEERSTPLDVFIQVNLTEDPDRGGVEPESLEFFAERVLSVPNLRLLGLMAVASLEGQEERDFALVSQLAQRLRRLSPESKYLSAGMSGDFELALEYGATHLRIGSAITGNRAT